MQRLWKFHLNVAFCAQLMVVSWEIWFKCRWNIHYTLLEYTELENPLSRKMTSLSQGT
jgi:hypothetical protein